MHLQHKKHERQSLESSRECKERGQAIRKHIELFLNRGGWPWLARNLGIGCASQDATFSLAVLATLKLAKACLSPHGAPRVLHHPKFGGSLSGATHSAVTNGENAVVKGSAAHAGHDTALVALEDRLVS